jgi:hypothetical protein
MVMDDIFRYVPPSFRYVLSRYLEILLKTRAKCVCVTVIIVLNNTLMCELCLCYLFLVFSNTFTCELCLCYLFLVFSTTTF